jgi:hypothetical protein
MRVTVRNGGGSTYPAVAAALLHGHSKGLLQTPASTGFQATYRQSPRKYSSVSTSLDPYGPWKTCPSRS